MRSEHLFRAIRALRHKFANLSKIRHAHTKLRLIRHFVPLVQRNPLTLMLAPLFRNCSIVNRLP